MRVLHRAKEVHISDVARDCDHRRILEPGGSRPDLVLFIAYAFPPCPLPGATRPSHFAKYLERWGYNVKVITAFEPQQPRDDIVFVPNRQRVPNRHSIPGLTEMIMRKFLFPSDEAMLWSADAVKAAAHLVRRHRRTVVFSTFPPVNSHLVAWCLKTKYDVRWIADFRDPLAGSPGRALTNSQTRLGSIPTAVDQVVQAAIFKTADVIIANTDAVRERWRKQYPGYAAKVVNIWNGFDAEVVAAPARVPAHTCKVMAHTGIIYAGRHPSPLLESLDRLIGRGRIEPDKLRIDLIGQICWESTPNRELLERLERLGCVRATGAIPPTEARQAMREADYLLLLDVIIPGAGQQIPSKVFDYVTVGRPILAITTRNSPTDRVLARSGIPYACIYDDSSPDEADQALLTVLSKSAEPAQPAEWFLRTFDAVPRTRALAALIEGKDREPALTASAGWN